MTLTADKLDTFRTSLRTERLRVLGNIEALTAEFSTSLSDESEENGLESHIADQGTMTFLRERDISIEDAEERLLMDIDSAIARVDAGTFGTCTQCGAEIDTERLEALPWAALCISCANGS
jgi:RNA polymerase-binding protein DksA